MKQILIWFCLLASELRLYTYNIISNGVALIIEIAGEIEWVEKAFLIQVIELTEYKGVILLHRRKTHVYNANMVNLLNVIYPDISTELLLRRFLRKH